MINEKKLILFAFIMLFLTGCWSATEIENHGIVTACGIDLEGDQFKITVHIVESSNDKQSAGQSNITVLTSTGLTIFDAVRNVITYSPKILYWGFNQIFVINKDVFDKGLSCVTDFLIRDYEIRPTTWIAVTDKKASEILEGTVVSEPITGMGLDHLFKSQVKVSKGLTSQTKELVGAIANKGQDYACTYLDLKHVDGEKYIEIMGSALFQKEQFAGFVDQKISRGLMLLLSDVKGGITPIDIPKIGYTALEIISSSCIIRPQVKNNQLSFVVQIIIIGSIGEQLAVLNSTSKQMWAYLESLQANQVKNEVIAAIETIKEMGVDPVGFGKIVRATYPSIWSKVENDWYNTFRSIPVYIEVKSRLRSSGTLLANLKASKIKK